MPLYGALNLSSLSDLPAVTALAEEAWEAEVTVLNFTFEFRKTGQVDLLPPALHPTNPAYGTISFRRHADSPVGPFTLAELRMVARAGTHAGGYGLGAFADSPEAVAFLRERYGYPVREARVDIAAHHFGVFGSVILDGRKVFEAASEHLTPIAPGEVAYHPSFHLARLEGEAALLQVEANFAVEYVERGMARVLAFDSAAFGEPRIALTNSLPSTWMRGRLELAPVRWLIDPTRPAVGGSRKLNRTVEQTA